MSGNPTINKGPAAPRRPHPRREELRAPRDPQPPRHRSAGLSRARGPEQPGLPEHRAGGSQPRRHTEPSGAGTRRELRSWEGNKHLEREISHTPLAVSKAIGYLGPSVLRVGGYKPFSAIYPLYFFFPSILTPDFLADVSITAAFVPTYQGCCSMRLLCTSGNGAKQEATSRTISFLRQNDLSFSRFLLPVQDGCSDPHLPQHPPQRTWRREKAEQPEAETSFRHNQVKNTYYIFFFSDKSSVPKW